MILPRLIVVDREHYTLDLYEFKLRKRLYKRTERLIVTVGKEGSRTPHGLYFVGQKSRTPDWQIPPDPDYPESSWGTILEHGTVGNPFGPGGFISLVGKVHGVGIHDTSFPPNVGTDSSHGCIRTLTEDLLKIYDKCTEGTPVYLH